jgi:hypothetical protein
MSNTNLTAEQSRRIKESIKECDRYIALESPRSEDLRPQEIKDLLAFYIAHRANLQAAIYANAPTPAMA